MNTANKTTVREAVEIELRELRKTGERESLRAFCDPIARRISLIGALHTLETVADPLMRQVAEILEELDPEERYVQREASA